MKQMLKKEIVETAKRMGIAEANDMPKQDVIDLIKSVEPLRNDFAKHALTGLLANEKYFNPDAEHKMILEQNIFKRAFYIADGMIKESGILK